MMAPIIARSLRSHAIGLLGLLGLGQAPRVVHSKPAYCKLQP